MDTKSLLLIAAVVTLALVLIGIIANELARLWNKYQARPIPRAPDNPFSEGSIPAGQFDKGYSHALKDCAGPIGHREIERLLRMANSELDRGEDPAYWRGYRMPLVLRYEKLLK